MDSRIQKIIKILAKTYHKPKPSLNFKTPFELLVATVLSAQCTDERVNKVTPALFAAANTPEKLLRLGARKLENLVRPTGFYKAKTKSLLGAAAVLVKKFNGKVPANLEDLQKLPGVGRKTASVILAQAFKIPAFPVDRHVFRVANRLALAGAPQKTPEKTDLALRKNIPEKYWIALHMQLVYHGRQICRPKPNCGACPLLKHCSYGKIHIFTEEERGKTSTA